MGGEASKQFQKVEYGSVHLADVDKIMIHAHWIQDLSEIKASPYRSLHK